MGIPESRTDEACHKELRSCTRNATAPAGVEAISAGRSERVKGEAISTEGEAATEDAGNMSIPERASTGVMVDMPVNSLTLRCEMRPGCVQKAAWDVWRIDQFWKPSWPIQGRATSETQ